MELFFKYKEETSKYHKNCGRIFWQFRRNKHHGQVVGCKWFYQYPKLIAKSLGLDPKECSGHSVCRTGATFMADNGHSLLDLKRYGQWKSDSVAQKYVEESVLHKRKAAELMKSQINGDDEDEDEDDDDDDDDDEDKQVQHKEPPRKKTRIFDGCHFTNCTFSVH